MIFRSLIRLGLAAALGLSVTSFAAAFAAAQTASTKTAAETQQTKPKVKKPVARSTQKTQTTAKARAKKSTVKQTEQTQAKPIGIISAFFRPVEKTRPVVKARPGQKLSAKAAATQQATGRRAIVPQQGVQLTAAGNQGELRSERSMPRSGFFAALFGDEQVMLPQTRQLDAALAQKDARSPFQVRSEFEPQLVGFSGYNPGTIVIDTRARRLYLVESSSTARRYAIAVGKEGLEFKGAAKIGDKQEWPRWIPTKEMQQRDPRKYGQYKDGMPGGPDNPLGARAMYLYQGKSDTHVRIHGTNQPQTIGTNSSNGCFRMVNDHVKDLYSRVKVGTPVIVM
jgi:lipoprotein-anchoring transpeptidase ErfK/SrfK